MWKRLLSLLAKLESVYLGLQKPVLVYVLSEPEGMGKIIVRIDYKAKAGGKKILANNVRTGRKSLSMEEFFNINW